MTRLSRDARKIPHFVHRILANHETTLTCVMVLEHLLSNHLVNGNIHFSTKQFAERPHSRNHTQIEDALQRMQTLGVIRYQTPRERNRRHGDNRDVELCWLPCSANTKPRLVAT